LSPLPLIENSHYKKNLLELRFFYILLGLNAYRFSIEYTTIEPEERKFLARATRITTSECCQPAMNKGQNR